MKFFLPIIFLQCMSVNVLGHWIQQESIDYDDELTYQDLVNLNGSCYPLNSCTEYRIDQPFAPASGYHCSCHEQCWEFGMCCIDSPYRFKPQIQSCRNIGVTLRTYNVYMVDRCPYNTNSDSIWKSQCENEWNGEDDILMLSPVTSMDTSKTYKNYYCFKCHESTDNYISWDLSVDSIYSVPEKKNIYSVSYNQEYQVWEATLEENGVPFPANLSFQYPRNLQVQPMYCSKNKIDFCPDTWTDRHVREKCLAYAAFVSQGYSSYKNVHCALCNYESLDALTCTPTEVATGYGKKIFSFRNLLNINDFDGDKVGKKGECDEDHTWDPYSKICRKKICALPEFVIKNDRCVPP